MTLTEFLLARFSEDEDAAKAVRVGRWTSRVAYLDGDLYGHVSRQHPERVLAECAAKRRIVERCGDFGALVPSEHLARGVLALLALSYADHPDYRQEWRA